MRAAMNCALANRQILGHDARRAPSGLADQAERGRQAGAASPEGARRASWPRIWRLASAQFIAARIAPILPG